jgi:protein-S-isoprenylcysteine O-methyltransferase Ste14
MFNSIFKIIYFIQLMIAIIIRKSYERKYIRLDVEVQKKSTIELALLGLNGIGMIIPVVYVFSSWMDFANYNLSVWLGWVGVVLFSFAILLLWRSHHDLGRNWTPTVAKRYNAELITSGVYKHIRHPMYTAHLIWAVAQIMILHNWIAGYSFLIVQVPFYFIRIKNEERMMIEQFGAAYKDYMKKTSRLIPKLL